MVETIDRLDSTGSGIPPKVQVRRRRWRKWTVLSWQVVVCLAVFAIWQWLPKIPGITDIVAWADPFFISSPVRCAQQIYDLFTGSHGSDTIWLPLVRTVVTALIGSALGAIVGGVLGLVFSHWEPASRVFRPFIMLVNAVPKITIIPIIVLVVGSSSASDATVSFIIVFFMIFFNAYEGGRSVPVEMIQLSSVLGARSMSIMLKTRGPFAFAWSFGQIPNAVAHGLTGTVTTELFTGSVGLGATLIAAINTQNADLTFAVVFILGAVGVLLVMALDQTRRWLLHWW
jgi:NitT/TauT family transport system permease protein